MPGTPNMQDIMKIAQMKNTFEGTHPKAVAFVKDLARTGLSEGSVLEIKLTRPDGSEATTNLKVQPSDVEMLNEIKNMMTKR